MAKEMNTGTSYKLSKVRLLKGYSLPFAKNPAVTDMDNKKFLLYRFGNVIRAIQKAGKNRPESFVEFSTNICLFWIPEILPLSEAGEVG